ncbi:MAG TPA: plastocyanin/azurin family copper-binding protein [Kofleriaceae bacterium]|nr:plastocyanin/azurin family copper-binding protein [Kofleriaceae bacterium]
MRLPARTTLAALFTCALAAACGSGDDSGDGQPGDDGAVFDHDAPDDGAVIDGPGDAMAIDAPGIDSTTDAPVQAAINGCTEATAVDRTAAGASRTISFAGEAYTPPCIKISAGQTVVWNGDFSAHPLRPGLIVGGTPQNQPGNPIPPTSSGNTRQATFAVAGSYGFYCANHFPDGMMGAIYVEL